jgi:hypothetical protein
MAELLVRAAPHWMDALPQTEIDKLTPKELAQYNARTRPGDIIVVKPDGWKWGSEECLPMFIVIKIAALSVATARKYGDVLLNVDGTLKARRKYQVPAAVVNAAVTAGNSVVTVTLGSFNGGLITKV